MTFFTNCKFFGPFRERLSGWELKSNHKLNCNFFGPWTCVLSICLDHVIKLLVWELRHVPVFFAFFCQLIRLFKPRLLYKYKKPSHLFPRTRGWELRHVSSYNIFPFLFHNLHLGLPLRPYLVNPSTKGLRGF